MAYICLECGHIFEEGEEAHWIESRGEHWVLASQRMRGCPLCHGEFEDAKECKVCGSLHADDDLNGEVCDDCIDKYAKDIDMCFKIGKGDTEKVELNCFLSSMFEKEEIEHLLFESLKERNQHIKEHVQYLCERFVNADRSWFGERLLEELEKEKK